MAGAQRCLPIPVLLASAGLAAAGEPVGSRSDRVVGALLGVLLCLVVGLAVAWHHLCRLSAGRYHPLPMGHRALALLRGHWRRLRGHQHPGYEDGEVAVAAAPLDEEKELMPWSHNQRLEDEDEEEKEKEEEDEQEEEREDEEARASPLAGEQAAGGSAEALLSDLHAFSGTAAWGDAKPHVTAL